jgi:hypothetical protein
MVKVTEPATANSEARGRTLRSRQNIGDMVISMTFIRILLRFQYHIIIWRSTSYGRNGSYLDLSIAEFWKILKILVCLKPNIQLIFLNSILLSTCRIETE